MRYLLAAAVLGLAVVSALLAWRSRKDDAELPSLLALGAPPIVLAGERVTVFGGLSLPAGPYELGMYACQSGHCSRSLWLSVDGPGELWRSFGSVRFDLASEPATLHLRVFRSDQVIDSVIAEWSKSVAVVESHEAK